MAATILVDAQIDTTVASGAPLSQRPCAGPFDPGPLVPQHAPAFWPEMLQAAPTFWNLGLVPWARSPRPSLPCPLLASPES